MAKPKRVRETPYKSSNLGRFWSLWSLPRIMELPEDKLVKVLKHEAIHMGYYQHNKDFLDLASKVGATYSEASFDTPGILIEVRGENGIRLF